LILKADDMKLIKLNESQYKRLFEAAETLLTLQNGDDEQNSLPHNIGQRDVSAAGSEIEDKDGGHKFQDPFGGIKPGPDGELERTGLDKNMSRTGALNSGGLRGGTGGF
jgi:hypothetical protein